MAINSGYATTEVYDWACKQGRQVVVVKGDGGSAAVLGVAAPVDVGRRGKKVKWGIKVWPVNSGMAKEELYRWLRLERPTDEDLQKGIAFPPGYCHFPRLSFSETSFSGGAVRNRLSFSETSLMRDDRPRVSAIGVDEVNSFGLDPPCGDSAEGFPRDAFMLTRTAAVRGNRSARRPGLNQVGPSGRGSMRRDVRNDDGVRAPPVG